jgi:uncharacterized protein (DUF58 family)
VRGLGGLLWRVLRPRRTIRPTRDGWWCLFAAFGLGFAALNTGNNLLYVLVCMLLGLILVSGILSEQSMRGLRLTPVLPEDIHAGRPALFGATIENRKRWLASHSLTIEVLGAGNGRSAPERYLYLPRLEARGDRLLGWEQTLAARGRQRLPGIRVTTRFPFGLFVKSSRVLLDSEVIVYPAVQAVSRDLLRPVGGAGAAPLRRRGRGDDLYNLRDYQSGDDPRLIHWRSSAKRQSLTVRELEAETTPDARLVLEGTGRTDPQRLEVRLSQAASLAVHLLGAGAAVGLAGPGIRVPLGRGRGQERRILTALALYDPASPGPADPGAAAADRSVPVREIRIGLD